MAKSLSHSRDKESHPIVLSIIFSIAIAHFINDFCQSILAAIYPTLKVNYKLDYIHIGFITAIFQLTGSIFQPIVGFYTDKKFYKNALTCSLLFSFFGILFLAFAPHYYVLLLGAAFIGIGSSIFHPEASRIARNSSGGKHGLAQSLFQAGGNIGASIGPLVVSFLISRNDQKIVAWFSMLSLIGTVFLIRIVPWRLMYQKSRSLKQNLKQSVSHNLSSKQVKKSIFILFSLMFAKYVYLSVFVNFYIFYLIHHFSLTTSTSQLLLFVFLGSIGIGTMLGGVISDKIGAGNIMWISILGILPFTLLLPYVDLKTTIFFSAIIGFLLSAAFPAIIVFAQCLMPNNIGTMSGIFYGLAYGISGISAVLLGYLIDTSGIEFVFKIASFLPFLGFTALLLPKLKTNET